MQLAKYQHNSSKTILKDPSVGTKINDLGVQLFRFGTKQDVILTISLYTFKSQMTEFESLKYQKQI